MGLDILRITYSDKLWTLCKILVPMDCGPCLNFNSDGLWSYVAGKLGDVGVSVTQVIHYNLCHC